MNERGMTTLQNLFTLATRELCMNNLRKVVVPKFDKPSNVQTTTKASVLVPMCKVDNVPSLLYTVKASKLKTDSGHVTFPGGKCEIGESAIQTALRETTEDIGISPKKIDVWGEGPIIPGRHRQILIVPVVGAIPNLAKEDFNINPKEVQQVFTVPIEVLCDPNNQFYTQFRNGHIMPVFVADEYKIWGVTAYVTHIFLSSLLPRDFYTNDWMKKKINIQNDSERVADKINEDIL